MTIDLPASLTRAVSISWTMDSNHGVAESPFSGHVQTQRGAMERWKFTMAIRRMNRRDAAVAAAFFMRLEGRLNTFRMGDPSACLPLGRATGHPKLTASHAAGAATLTTYGWSPNVPGILRAGDWIQLGDQLTRLTADATSAADGTASISIWPRLYLTFPADTPLIVRDAKGIFRFTSDLPSYEVRAADYPASYQFQLTGTQEILT